MIIPLANVWHWKEEERIQIVISLELMFNPYENLLD